MATTWVERLRAALRPAAYLGRNRLTLGGAVLTTGAALTMIGFWALDLVRPAPLHPYSGIVLYVGLPAVFVLGLLLMPLGVWLERARRRRSGNLPEIYPAVDFSLPTVQRTLLLTACASLLNVLILSVASYRAVEHMDSAEFCGTTCHSVMQPEHTSYLDSPHSRVACVQCHIGPGASWFVKSKLSGARQVWTAMLGTHSRPIPTPIEHLRPARETCEQCHWPQKPHGDKLVVRTHYADDEHNTPSTNVLMLKVGGRTPKGDVGIHGHHLGVVRYTPADAQRQVIPTVSYVDASGRSRTYTSPELLAQAAKGPPRAERAMDCLDCHNRPTHVFELPEQAVDRALSEGRLSADLPFLKKQAIALLRAEYPDRDTATRRIAEALREFYEKSQPELARQQRAKIVGAAEQLGAIYLRNVFPYMKVTWGTYPNNLAHDAFPGCFRCHDDQHVSSDGKAISQDCGICHTILAADEANPKILEDLGVR